MSSAPGTPDKLDKPFADHTPEELFEMFEPPKPSRPVAKEFTEDDLPILEMSEAGATALRDFVERGDAHETTQ